VRILRPTREDEVLEAFVRGERDSPRWGERVRELEELHGGNVRAILEDHRAWLRREGLFFGFPDDVQWFRAALKPDEVLDILFIDWKWWLRLTGATRRPLDAARLMSSGAIPGAPVEEEDEVIARHAATNSELIAVRAPGSYLVLLEGHVRLTAYALFPRYLPTELEIYLGESARMADWSQY
jgi:hypothetical protein